MNEKAPFLISENLARRHNAIPIDIKDGNLVVAMNNNNIYAIEDIKLATGMNVVINREDKLNIEKYIDQYYSKTKKESSNYISKIFDNILKQSVIENASDIHIEPKEDKLIVRIRVDGYLRGILEYPTEIYNQLNTFIKLLCNMDIAEKRLPQDGRVDKKIDDSIVDLRISTMPIVDGEKIVIRILDRNKFLKDKKELGFTSEGIGLLNNILKKKSGIILITGPTGSGKTTTLYSILKDLNDSNKNIVTIEDPVEYKLKGINQIQVNSKLGLDFATGLRAILRQDPDIIMVGEIRDSETASIAIRAAITGHLVISTMHTNDSISAINRLIDMNIPPYLIASSLTGVISQRLVRKLCAKCTIEYKANDQEKDILKLDEDIIMSRSSGCNYCDNKGYKNRIAVYELLNISNSIRKKILETRDIEEIKEIAIREGMITLDKSCTKLVKNKITSLEEYMSIIHITT